MLCKLVLMFVLIISSKFSLAEDSFDEMITKANAGDVEAQYDLGWSYYHGQNAPLDFEESARWYMEAAKQGSMGFCSASRLPT